MIDFKLDHEEERQLLVDAIKGVGFPNMQYASDMEKEGAVAYNGDQHRIEWKWNDEYLDTLSKMDLVNLWITMDNQRRELRQMIQIYLERNDKDVR